MTALRNRTAHRDGAPLDRRTVLRGRLSLHSRASLLDRAAPHDRKARRDRSAVCGRVHAFGLMLLGLALAARAGAQTADFASVDAYLEQQVRTTEIPGLVALAVNGSDVIYEGAFGSRNGAAGEAMTPDTIFRIASMTKPIAATIIMMLVEEGKLGLDDPISRYIPEFADREVVESFDAATGSYTTRPQRNEATIRHLLSHSSGLAYGFASDVISAISASEDPPADSAMPLLYDPGAGWSYAMGISIVGTVAERVEGMGLDTLMRDRLFRPLGMQDTSFIVRAADHGRVATIHRPGEDGSLVETPNPIDIRSPVSGDGGLQSTARDYAKFIQLILNSGVAPNGERLISADTIREMSRSQLGSRTVTLQDEPQPALARAFPLGAGRDGFGLGFQITGQHENPRERAPGSLSWAGIFNTEFWIDPARGIGGVLLMQYLPFYDDDAIETLTGFEQRINAVVD